MLLWLQSTNIDPHIFAPESHLSNIVLLADETLHPSLFAAESMFMATVHESSFSSEAMGTQDNSAKPGRVYN